MLKLDLSKLEKNYDDFSDYVDDFLYFIDNVTLICEIIAVEGELTFTEELERKARTELNKSAIYTARFSQALLLTQFWLKNKERFEKIDRLINRHENLPLEHFEETSGEEEDEEE